MLTTEETRNFVNERFRSEWADTSIESAYIYIFTIVVKRQF